MLAGRGVAVGAHAVERDVEHHAVVRDRLEQGGGEDLGRGGAGLREDDRELVAAEPRDHVGVAQPLAQGVRDAHDQLPIAIVARLLAANRGAICLLAAQQDGLDRDDLHTRPHRTRSAAKRRASRTSTAAVVAA